MDGSLLGEDLDGILAALPASSLDYQEWVGVGMALRAEGYGCEVWDAWSAADAARYHAGECERKWRSFGDGGEGRVNGGTLVQMALERGYESISFAPPTSRGTWPVRRPAACCGKRATATT